MSDKRRHRTAREVGERCLALFAVGLRREAATVAEVRQWLAQHQVGEFLSYAEQEFVQDEHPSERQSVDFSWRIEALGALLWALGDVPSLEPLNVQFDLRQYQSTPLFSTDPKAFLAQVSLRPAEVLNGAEDFLYRQHWRVRDAELFGRPMPPELHPGIVYERRYALSWVVGWGEDWDDVPTDT